MVVLDTEPVPLPLPASLEGAGPTKVLQAKRIRILNSSESPQGFI